MKNNPIGVFDSGIGGLTVVKEIIKELPNESIIYLGDTARVPYGTRGKEVIKKFALGLTDFLLQKKVTHQFFVTDAPERVYKVAANFLGQTLNGKLKKVTL